MTYRCVDCVFSEIKDKKNCSMLCLKHKKETTCMTNCCEDLILVPLMFISHIVYAMDKDKGSQLSWIESDRKTKEILSKYGFYGMEVE